MMPSKSRKAACVICTHPGHKALLEIISEAELDKYQKAEGGYEVLGTYEDRQAALAKVKEVLLAVSHKDPSMTRAHELVKECFQDTVSAEDILPDSQAERPQAYFQ